MDYDYREEDEWTPLLLPGNPVYEAVKQEIPNWWLRNIEMQKALNEGKHIIAREQHDGRLQFERVTYTQLRRFQINQDDEVMEDKGILGFY